MDKYKILLVDDEPNILSSLRRLLRNERANIITAGSAEEALRIMEKESVQVVVTDNLMPGMTGVDLLKLIKQKYPDTIRLILSGHSELSAVLSAVNEGEAFRFILKPWDDIDLKTTISIALAHYKLNDDNKALREQLEQKNRLLDIIGRNHPNIAKEYEL